MANNDIATTMDSARPANNTSIFSSLVDRLVCICKAHCIGIFPLVQANDFLEFLAHTAKPFATLQKDRLAHYDVLLPLNISFF